MYIKMTLSGKVRIELNLLPAYALSKVVSNSHVSLL